MRGHTTARQRTPIDQIAFHHEELEYGRLALKADHGFPPGAARW